MDEKEAAAMARKQNEEMERRRAEWEKTLPRYRGMLLSPLHIDMSGIVVREERINADKVKRTELGFYQAELAPEGWVPIYNKLTGKFDFSMLKHVIGMEIMLKEEDGNYSLVPVFKKQNGELVFGDEALRLGKELEEQMRAENKKAAAELKEQWDREAAAKEAKLRAMTPEERREYDGEQKRRRDYEVENWWKKWD